MFCCSFVYTRVFHKHTKLAILALLPTLYSHIFAVLLLYLNSIMLVNLKLDVTGYGRTAFQGCILNWYSSFEWHN